MADTPDDKTASPVIANPWQDLRRYTAARIALGRAGVSQPTAPQLAFQHAHALARDAVHTPLDIDHLLADLRAATGKEPVRLHSAAPDRAAYLQRPDWGRRLAPDSRAALEDLAGQTDAAPDVAVVIADGLSAFAVQSHAAPLLAAVLPSLAERGISVSAPVVVEQGRVAVGDAVGHLLGARLTLLLVGERPGLSSPDSLGVYLTHAPGPGRTDADRNCLSNIRPDGLRIPTAARTVCYLVDAILTRGLSGVGLKDDTVAEVEDGGENSGVGNFLLG